MNITKPYIARELESFYNREGGLKIAVAIKITFKKLSIEDGEQYFIFKDAYFNSNAIIILNTEEINGALDEATEQILNKVA